MNRTLGLCLIGAIGIAQVACGDSSGPSGGNGTVRVFAKDNPNAMNPAVVAPSFDRQGSSGAASYNGSLSGEMSVAIQTQTGVWVDVGSPASVSPVRSALSAPTSSVRIVTVRPVMPSTRSR